MRSQTGLSGHRISATRKFLLVPPAQETTAEKWLATIAAAKASDVNPLSGSLSMVVEPRLSSATRWYVGADPAEINGLEYAYLAGGEGPQIETKAGWDVDGVEIRVILDLGAGFIAWRGWYANAGACCLTLQTSKPCAKRSRGAFRLRAHGRIKSRRITFATDAEMAATIADLDRRIGAASTPRVSQVRISSSKGT